MFRLLIAAASAVALLLAGCAGSLAVDPSTAGNHPANPGAPTAAFPAPSQTLAIADRFAATLPADRHDHVGPGENDPLVPLPGEGGHDMNSMGHDMQDMEVPTTRAAVVYTCPMHPEVHADAPGRCSICNMKLVQQEGGAQ